MGGAESKTIINNLSEQISNIAMSTVQNCEITSTQEQNLEYNNTGLLFWGNTKVEQTTEIKSSCFSDVSKQTDMQNKIIQAISQATTSQSVGILGAFGVSKSDAQAKLTNIVRNNVTMSNIEKSYTAIKQKQSVVFNNKFIIGYQKLELTQGSKVFAAAALQEIDKAGIFNSIATHVDQTSSAKMDNPLDFIAKIVGSVGDTVMSGVLFFVIIIAGIVLGAAFILRMGSGGGTSGPAPQEQPLAVQYQQVDQ